MLINCKIGMISHTSNTLPSRGKRFTSKIHIVVIYVHLYVIWLYRFTLRKNNNNGKIETSQHYKLGSATRLYF